MQEGDNLVIKQRIHHSDHQQIGAETRKTFKELRRNGELCDVVIKVEGKTFPCHRLVLSACSPYFRALFTNELSKTERREIIIPAVTADIMKLIIDFAYELKSEISRDNIEQLLPAADQFHVNGLVKSCCEFLTAHICVENCIGIYKFARSLYCRNLELIALRFIMENFNDVQAYSNEFIQLSVEEVCAFLTSDELNVKNEEIVFEAIIRWIDYDPDMRKSSIVRLLNTIRLGLISSKFFVEKVKCHPYVRDSEACRATVIETLKCLYALDLDDYNGEPDVTNPTTRPRMPHEVLFATGGWSGGSPTNIIETFDTRSGRWVVTDALDTGARAYHGTVCTGQKIYILGGFDGSAYFNSVRCFNPVTRVWTEVAPMYSKRCYVSVAVLDEHIYAIGGYDGFHRMNTAERYYPPSNQWSRIASMNVFRSDANAAVLKGKVYICGGFDGHQCLSSAEVYSPDTNQWTVIAPMRSRRSGISVVAYGNAVYALGGFNGNARLNSVEKYCQITNTWQSVASMYSPRSNFTAQVLDRMIYAIGGFDGVTTIFNVECYDGATDEWLVAPDMNLNRSALSCCIVSGLPYLQDYIHGLRERGRRRERLTVPNYTM